VFSGSGIISGINGFLHISFGSKVGFPISRVMILANSFLRRLKISPTLRMMSPLFGAGTKRHFSYASLAAMTAFCTSSLSDKANSPMTSSKLAGL
jgi:hypothetical protein